MLAVALAEIQEACKDDKSDVDINIAEIDEVVCLRISSSCIKHSGRQREKQRGKTPISANSPRNIYGHLLQRYP